MLEKNDEYFMKFALDEANRALSEEEIPIGAVVVCNNKVVGKGHNMTQQLKDVTAHAEIMAITAAESNLGNKYLNNCTLYVTIEPCVMCAGAIGWSQISRVVYGASDIKKGYSTFIIPPVSPFHPKTIVTSGVLEQDCSSLITEFFEKRR